MAAPNIIWDDVTALAPELADVTLAAQNKILDMVAQEVDSGPWGSQEHANTAGEWLARHLATVFVKQGGASQIVESARVGDVSETYAKIGDWRTMLSTTRYGLEYLRLARLWLPRALTT